MSNKAGYTVRVLLRLFSGLYSIYLGNTLLHQRDFGIKLPDSVEDGYNGF